jgi:hypothetical protein
MEQGLWTAIFSSGSIAGGGVVYLSAGKIVGGDSQFYFIGTYQFDDESNQLEANLAVIPFVSGAISIFGLQLPRYDLRLSGVLSAVEATISGHSPAYPQLRLGVKLVKRLDGQL